MKRTIISLCIIFISSIAYSGSEWDALTWDQSSWYDNKNISGQIVSNVTGQSIGVNKAKISIDSLNKFVYSDLNGHFSFCDIPDGIYNLLITTDYFQSMQVKSVIVEKGQAKLPIIELFNQKNRFNQNEVDLLLHNEREKWDIDNKGKIGLQEAIHALSISSGFTKTE